MNNSTSNYGANNSAQAFLMGSGFLAQALLVIVISALLFILMMTLETIYLTWLRASRTRIEILPYSTNAENKMKTIVQNPKAPNSITLPLSENERTGAEFSYSFFIFINPSNINSNQTTTQGLRHVFHKGYSNYYPLMGPGVFVKTDSNALRVYMNSSKTWNNFVDIPNIPLKKWVHIVLVGRKNTVEIYVNGNISKKMRFDGVLYQNYQDLILFSQRTATLPGSTPISITGGFSGSLSSMVYYSYAISYSEIQGLLNEGPSDRTEESVEGNPNASPYLVDSWWVR